MIRFILALLFGCLTFQIALALVILGVINPVPATIGVFALNFIGSYFISTKGRRWSK